jgi:beta-glucanase (GH16 family)
MRARHRTSVLVAALVLLASAPPTVAAATGPPTPCGGLVLAKSGGGRWRCTFDDEFGGRTLNRRAWVPQQTANSFYHSGPECFVDRPANVSVAHGALTLTVRKESRPFACVGGSTNTVTQYTSGMVSTYGTFSQTYGRFEVRAKLPGTTARGLQESMWLYPVDLNQRRIARLSRDEIDIGEAFSRYPDRVIPYVHSNAVVPAADATATHCLIRDLATFHRYVVEWTPRTISFAYDGKTCLVHRSSTFDRPFFVALTQALGVAGNAFDPAVTPLPATTEVDYVRVWK